MSAPRYLGMTGIAVGLYLIGRLVVTPPQTNPLVLVGVLPAAAIAGILVARFARGRPARRGRSRPSDSAARWTMFGLAGSGLVLAQILPPTVWEWLLLGVAGLMVAGAGHAWVKERQRTSQS